MFTHNEKVPVPWVPVPHTKQDDTETDGVDNRTAGGEYLVAVEWAYILQPWSEGSGAESPAPHQILGDEEKVPCQEIRGQVGDGLVAP